MSQPDYEPVERLTNPDPFELARKLSQKLRTACECETEGGIKFLWLYVSKHGIGCPLDKEGESSSPTLEHWMNVVDEAAIIGVERLVISSQEDLTNLPYVWEIADWAQSTHGMIVGIHIFANDVSEAMRGKLLELNVDRLRLFVAEESYEKLSHLENDGIRVRVAKAAPDAPQHPCNMPQAMLFVNPNGELYTCGMVEGKRGFWLGNIFEGFFSKIVHDPALPHSVPFESQDVERGCEGCPPLLARYLYED